MTRHASTHAAGVIVADRPLVDLVPLHRITGKDPSGGALKAVTQFPMETAESIGLLKVDFLGLSTLTIMRKACELIARHRGIQYSIDTLPYRHDSASDEQRAMLDDAFAMMGRGETIGVFQVESGGMQQMLRQMRPRVFENIIAAISLFRPRSHGIHSHNIADVCTAKKKSPTSIPGSSPSCAKPTASAFIRNRSWKLPAPSSTTSWAKPT